MSLRIIAGERKGMTLKTRDNEGTRPLLGRVRQSMFDVIADRVPGASVADLFAGSGACALESLSRGARFAVLVENNHEAIRCIDANRAHLRYTENSKVVKGTLPAAVDFLSVSAGAANLPFDLMFVMPPFGESLLGPVLLRIAALRDTLLTDDALLIGQLEKRETVPDTPAGLELVDERSYGTNILLFYQKALD